MSSDEQCEKECPLCMEPLEIDDIDFYPCKCEYQICRFCWHRLRTDENGLCPACRQPYPENPVNFKPLSTSEVLKIKSEKKQKALQQRNKISESRKHLASYRVLQKNLVYVVGLSSRVADPEILKKPDFFGKFGRILKIAVGTSSSANAPQSASYTAYVTYAKYEDALRAIQAVNNALLDGRTVRASLGTTKYCSSFLRGQTCHKPECMYLHNVADSEVSFTKDDMHLGRHTEYERKLIESTLLKDKGQLERVALPANFKRKHSHSNSRDRSNTLHTVSSTGALERNYGRNALGHQKQQSRTNSKSRSETPNFGSLSNTLSSSEKTVNSVEAPDKNSIAEDAPIQVTTVSAKAQLPLLNGERRVEPPVVRCSSETVHCLQDEEEPVRSEPQKPVQSGSRLSQWTSAEVEVNENHTTDDISDKKENIAKAVTWPDSDVKEALDYPKEPSPMNGFDWQRLLGLNLDDDHIPNTRDVELPEISPQNVEYPSCVGRPSRLSLHSDDDLGFDPVSESVKGLADLLAHERATEMFPQRCVLADMQERNNSFKAPTAAASLFSMGQQFGWSSVGVNNDILRTPVDNSFSMLADHTPVNNCNSSTDYFASYSSFRYPAAGQPLPQQSLNLGAPQQPLNPFGAVATKPPMLNNQFTDPPPALPSRYPQQKFPSFNQGTPLSPLTAQPPASPGTSQLNEWQEGLKALLPNVNVRFVPELNSTGYPITTRPAMAAQNSWSLSNSQAQQMHQQHQQSSLHPFYGQPSSQNHQLITPPANPQVPLMPLNSISQTPPQWLLPPPGFTHLSKR